MSELEDIDSMEHEKICFIISPIGEPNSEIRERSDKIFRHIISPAAKDNGLIPLRADHMATPGMITTQIIKHILKDAMVVADLSDHNANVFYELALRHSFKKPVVQLIIEDQRIPFDVQGTRTVKYNLTLDGVAEARETVTRQIKTALSPGFEVESPVTLSARLEEFTRSTTPESQVIIRTLSEQIDNINKTITEMSKIVCRPSDFKEAIPPLIKDQIGDILRRYAEEIELLKSVRHAGVCGIYKRREMAIKAFTRAIDEESRRIEIVGSSLKGLIQKEEYKEISEKLRFKTDRGLVHLNFLLTHPIVADFRASQENRRPTEIGLEIIDTLEKLKEWSKDYCHVRLYLGTPTCFAIKTSRQMLINPYPYISVSYDSPCLLLEYSQESGSDRPGYFFDEFNSRHFGAWDTDLSVHINNFDETITQCREMLTEYARDVENLLAKGKSLKTY